MTTKPKAKKFRIRNSSPLAGAAQRAQTATATRDRSDTAGAETDVDVAANTSESQTEQGSTEVDLDAIRAEGLTGRQLRMARRLAQKNEIPATSDLDAVRQLRARGIDPFDRAAMLELVVPGPDRERAAPRGKTEGGKVQLPQTVAKPQLPTHALAQKQPPGQNDRIAKINEIQRDIARRRRRRLALLTVRLAVFVGLPTLVAGWYYFAVATPMYTTKAEFVIQQADSGGAGGMGGLFSGTGFATSQDSVAVQSYLQSRDAMLRLDADAGFRDHFSQGFIDPIQRLPDDATMERTYELFKSVVQIGYDPTEGIVKLEVSAADPAVSATYSRRLIDYAEERVDQLTQRLRGDQMDDARASFDEAEAKMLTAQNRVLELQERLGVMDPVAESGSVMGQITTFETQLRQKQLERQSLLANRRPNQARLSAVEGEIARLQDVVDDLRGQMTDGGTENSSLARISAQLRVAETDLQTRMALMQQALESLVSARLEANRQTRYLSLGVSPIAPDAPSYPRAFENTLLAFLIFAGLYLLVSLTASILREQVSG